MKTRDWDKRYSIAREFGRKSFHDSLLKSFSINSCSRRWAWAEVVLEDCGNPKRRRTHRIVLMKCKNFRVNLDFDVLHDNRCGQLNYCEGDASIWSLTRFVVGQRGMLNIDYHPDVDHPQDKKLEHLNCLIMFRFVFFGGTIEVVAEGFKYK